MGTGVIAGLALSAAASAAQYANTRNVQKRQDNIAADGIRKQAANQREANARLNQTLDTIKGSRPDGARESAQVTYLDQVRRNLARANAGLATQGVSEQYDEMATEAQGDTQGYAARVADLMSRIDAGALQRQQEGNAVGNMRMDFSRIGGNARGDDFLTRLMMGGVRRNAGLDLAAGLLSAGAGAAANYQPQGYEGTAGVRPYYDPNASSAWTSAYGGSMAGRGPNYGYGGGGGG